jgi:hypothetical protein
MIDPRLFENVTLYGGFRIGRLELSDAPLIDALGREAIARTRITGGNLEITIRSGLSEDEFSVTLYHEVLEAATVASVNPPESVRDLNEEGFERAAYSAHVGFGVASVENLNRMLQSYRFREN